MLHLNHTPTEAKLMEAMAAMDVVDGHEHLMPEEDRVGQPRDVFTLFAHYIKHDLYSAGMDRDWAEPVWKIHFRMSPRPTWAKLLDTDLPLAERWALVRPYWEQVRHGSFARAARLAAKMVYGVDDINDDTYEELSARMAAENTPGLYKRILCDRCNIRLVLNNCDRTGQPAPLVTVMPVGRVTDLRTRAQVEALKAEFGVRVKGLDDCVAIMAKQLDAWLAQGVVALKTACIDHTRPDAVQANASLKTLLDGGELTPKGHYEPLKNYLLHQMYDLAAERDLVVAAHAGVWGDFRAVDPKFMFTMALGHPRTMFDLFHLGMPFVRDAIVVAKNLTNVHLNLCWSHVMSQAQVCSAVDELIDQVPLNKITAFGADYGLPVEKVVGHLHMARENLAEAFGKRIDRGRMSHDEAVAILRTWFYDNPLALYRRAAEHVMEL